MGRVAPVVAQDEFTEWLRSLTVDELRVVRTVIEAELRDEESARLESRTNQSCPHEGEEVWTPSI